MKKFCAVMVLLSLFLSASAQTFRTNGSATKVDSTEYQLTGATLQYKAGSVWNEKKIDLRKDFIINTEIFLGNNNKGTQGIAFVIQSRNVTALGYINTPGYGGISPSLAVEFDTHQDGESDRSEDHLAFMKNGDYRHINVNNPDSAYPLPNLEDGKWHKATFLWNASTHTFSVNFLNNTYTYIADIIKTIFSGSPNVYWGFTGATGIVANDQRVRFGAATFSTNIAPAVKLGIADNILKYAAPAAIQLNATAADEDGKITKVEFYNGATLLHTDTTAPYSFLWKDVPAGDYALVAKAADDSNGVAASDSINVSVLNQNIPPVVSILSPIDTTYDAPATIHLVAGAKDPGDKISKVDFYNGATLLYSDTSAPYGFAWGNVPVGSYNLTAAATDDEGLSATSAAVTVTVRTYRNLGPGFVYAGSLNKHDYYKSTGAYPWNEADTIARSLGAHLACISSDAENQFIQKNVTNSTDGPYQGGYWIGLNDKAKEGTFVWSNGEPVIYTNWEGIEPNNAGGVNVDYVEFYPGNGEWNDLDASFSRRFIIEFQSDALNVFLTTPADNAVYAGAANIKLTATAFSNGNKITKIEFYNGADLLFTDTKSPYTYSLTNAPPGSYTFTAIATNSAGDTAASQEVHVLVVKKPVDKAGALYGTTPSGGSYGGGTIAKFMPATNDLVVVKSFESLASSPYGNLVQAGDGKLYGMTHDGGKTDYGVIFSFDPSSSTYIQVNNFEESTGGKPNGGLVLASDGKLYGMTRYGGSKGRGVIFSFDPSTSIYKRLLNFDDSIGNYPLGNLFQASDGKLYGMTPNGGSKGFGVIFSYDPSSGTYEKLWDFDNTSGAYPRGGLMQASNGRLYGITAYGGSKGRGVIFSYDPSSSAYTMLSEFNDTTGANTYGDLVQASDGKLYGTTGQGGLKDFGVIFSFDLSSSAYTKLKDFDNTSGSPRASLMRAGDGKLYGITVQGGAGDAGVIFSFDPSTSTYSKLKDLTYSNGAYTHATLIQASNGKLYGVTARGGADDAGVIFSFDPSSSTYRKLRNIASNETGTNVSASLVQGKDKKLYGITRVGGRNNMGVIFSFDPVSSTFTKLKDFDSPNGAYPTGGLMEGKDRKLYGMTTGGGSNNVGVIFSYDPSSSTYAKLKDFDIVGGSNPNASLVQASDGKLYGMTSFGGIGPGVIFSFDPVSSTFKKLRNFGGNGGASPPGSLVQAGDGKLYGLTGNNAVIFSFDPFSSSYTELRRISDSYCFGSLIQGIDGKLYGTSYYGGKNGFGFVFSFVPSSNTFRMVASFDYENGAYPRGSLLQASDGKLYGNTSNGGSKEMGVIFSFDPLSPAHRKLKDYEGDNGANSSAGSAFIEVLAADSVPPAVTLTAPANNASFTAPASILLTADAEDSDGTITKVEFYADSTLLYTATGTPYAFKWENVVAGNYTLTAKATDNSGLATTSAPVHISVVPNKPPTVNIINPANHQTFLKGGTIHLQVAAKDPDGSISSVEFYNGTALLNTDLSFPYTFDWSKVPAGNYTITAKATDNRGAVTTSVPLNISVVINKAPSVSIINPASGESFTSPATINLEAAALDPDGRIVTVDFYNGSTLLNPSPERKLPYTYQWQNVPAGTYILTAVAQDNWGIKTTSAPVIVTVTSNTIISSRSSIGYTKAGANGTANVSLAPNPAKNIVTIYVSDLQISKRTTLSIISSSGVVMKTMRLASLTRNVQLNVSSLVSGVYTIKIMSGNSIMYKRFVKL